LKLAVEMKRIPFEVWRRMRRVSSWIACSKSGNEENTFRGMETPWRFICTKDLYGFDVEMKRIPFEVWRRNTSERIGNAFVCVEMKRIPFEVWRLGILQSDSHQ
jgi:hypothetical protein